MRTSIDKLKPELKSKVLEFREWLKTLPIKVNPTVQINYPYTAAVIVVDLGTPLVPAPLPSDKYSELVSRMNELAKLILGTNEKVRFSVDNSTGIHWSGVQHK